MRFCVAGNQFRKWLGAFALLISACLGWPAYAADSPTPFEEANRLYEQGKYAEAIERYETMLKAGRNSPGVFFNLGNAYFKQEQLGRALLNYHQANRLAPRDPDILGNLRFARDRVAGAISVQPPVWEHALRYFTLNELAAMAAILFWIWAGLYCAARFRPSLAPALRVPTLASGTLLILSILAVVMAFRVRNQPIAIVVAKQATVHLGPLAESQPAYTAADGTELRVLASRPGWLQVSDRSDRTGWLAERDAFVL